MRRTTPSALEMFDRLAVEFARETDLAIQTNCYTRGDIIVDLAQRLIPAGRTVVDYGCGPGRLSLLLARSGFRVRGVDLSEGMLAQARALDRHGLDLEFEMLDEELVPDSCDAIVCSSVIEYVVDPDELMRQFHKALRSSGVLIISYANKSSLWRKYFSRPGANANPMRVAHHQVWDWPEFRVLLERHGFRAATGATFFESPWDRRPWGRLFRRVPLVGSLGVVAARVAK